MRKLSLAEHFSVLPDPRRHGHSHTRHELVDIIVISVLAVICGAESWVEIESFGREKKPWLRKFLTLPSGVPSHDTFGRVFSLLDQSAFERCFSAWAEAMRSIPGGVIAIDGKSVRRSHGKDMRPLHLVNAFAADQGLVLGQRAVDGKTNEITAIPELLETLFLKGCIVTIDAMGTQGWIAKKIKEHKADYILSVKGNQGRLFENIQKVLAAHTSSFDSAETSETAHGRIEERVCVASGDLSSIRDCDRWVGLKSIARVTSIRTVRGATSEETRYFISSLKPDAKRLMNAVRAHWSVENSLHWSLDMSFREDESRVRAGHAGKNLALVRKIALNLLRTEKTAKVGIKAKRLKAGWSAQYLERVLGIGL